MQSGNKIGVASDHAGFETKAKIQEYLKSVGYEVKDYGAYSSERADYPDHAHALANAVESNDVNIGIALCGSGNGISMTLNKHQGIRSALCWTPEIAELGKLHNNANVCAIPARYVTESKAIEIVKAFLSATFEGGRHQIRVEKIPVRQDGK